MFIDEEKDSKKRVNITSSAINAKDVMYTVDAE